MTARWRGNSVELSPVDAVAESVYFSFITFSRSKLQGLYPQYFLYLLLTLLLYWLLGESKNFNFETSCVPSSASKIGGHFNRETKDSKTTQLLVIKSRINQLRKVCLWYIWFRFMNMQNKYVIMVPACLKRSRLIKSHAEIRISCVTRMINILFLTKPLNLCCDHSLVL